MALEAAQMTLTRAHSDAQARLRVVLHQISAGHQRYFERARSDAVRVGASGLRQTHRVQVGGGSLRRRQEDAQKHLAEWCVDAVVAVHPPQEGAHSLRRHPAQNAVASSLLPSFHPRSAMCIGRPGGYASNLRRCTSQMRIHSQKLCTLAHIFVLFCTFSKSGSQNAYMEGQNVYRIKNRPECVECAPKCVHNPGAYR